MMFTTLFFFNVIFISQSVVLSLPLVFDEFGGFINGHFIASPGDIPYQVSLQAEDESKNSVHFCSGSILNEYYVITIADCVTKYPDNGTLVDFKIVAGTINLNRPGKVHEIKHVIIHEEYEGPFCMSNNIALIKVSTPFKLSHDIGFVTLPKQDEIVRRYTEARVSGFGRLSENSDQILQLAFINFDQEPCVVSITNPNIEDTLICAYDSTKRIRLCSSVLGGPLIAHGKLVGLVSTGNCFDPYDRTIHVLVSPYINWIEKNIKSVK